MSAKKLYHIETDRGVGIRAATSEEEVWQMMAREVGTSNVRDIHEATPEEIAWVRGMGGRVPNVAQ